MQKSREPSRAIAAVESHGAEQRRNVSRPLGELVREKLDAGTLPHDAPLKLWAGRGEDHRCTLCDEPILRSHIEYEPQYDGRPPIRLHVGCYGFWEGERRRRGYPPSY